MAKKSARKKTKSAAAASKKKTVKKAAAKKKTAAKKTVKKKAVKKKAASPARLKKAAKKTAAKKTTAKKTAKKAPASKKTVKKAAVKPAAASKPARPTPAKPAESPAARFNPPPPAPVEPLDAPPLTEAQLRKVKTGLSRKDLVEFRQLLLERRAEILGDVASMEEARSGGSGGDLSHMPLHMADVGSDAYEQEFTLGLMESERKLLREIDDALGRIARKTYGVCIESGNPIPRERLEIKPWAKYTIEVVRERERRGL